MLVRLNILIAFFFICPVICEVQAQIFLPEEVIAKTQEGKILLRWEPASMQEWEASKEYGYKIQLFKTSDRLSPVMTKTTQPYAIPTYQNKIAIIPQEMVAYYEASIALLYPDQFTTSGMVDLMNNIVVENEHTLDTFRMSFLSFYSSLDMELAIANGLGEQFSVVPGDYIAVLQVPGFSSREVRINWEENKHADIERNKLTAAWGDLVVALQWSNKNSYKKYFGFHLEKSINGRGFVRQTEMPILDPSVGLEGNKTLPLMGFPDSLVNNYVPIRYRIRAVDYFGEVSKKYAEVEGYGFKTIRTSPVITMADQMEDNTAQLEWKVNEADLDLLKDFSVLRAPEEGGPYEVVKSNIAKNQREAYIPMEHEVNYFRIEANPIDGPSLSTMPVLIMGMDTLAPETPIVIGGVIDSTGAVRLEWHANHEDDLWGYRIFRANFAEAEYTPLTATPIMDTVFLDTLDLKFGTDHIYYVLNAADNRNNRSEFTEPIIIEKPDIVPPGSPLIQQLVQSNDTVEVHWFPSGARDVEQYQLFRKDVDQDKIWTLVAQFDTAGAQELFFDTTIEFGITYSYTMRAIDDANLVSDFAPLEIIKVKEPEVEFVPIKEINTTIDKKNGTYTISWSVNDAERYRTSMLYRGFEEERITKYKYIDAPNMSYTGDLYDDKIIYFKLMPEFENQKRLYASEVISIDPATFVEELSSDKKSKKKKKERKKKRNKE